ncbi:MAG: hypothetical protein HFE77_01350 [Clostridiales bacterium]|nr:hypothetical protein [Clostridiales bacterium]
MAIIMLLSWLPMSILAADINTTEQKQNDKTDTELIFSKDDAKETDTQDLLLETERPALISRSEIETKTAFLTSILVDRHLQPVELNARTAAPVKRQIQENVIAGSAAKKVVDYVSVFGSAPLAIILYKIKMVSSKKLTIFVNRYFSI